jgi:glycerophosphoryl diester phosphodiesterase
VRVLAQDRGQAGLEEGLLAMRHQDEAQPGRHWLASYPMAVSTRVFVDVPVLCGHRGSGRGVVRGQRENTLPSFRAAVAAGLTWVEVDARVTADGVLVACHEAVAPDGRYISELAAAETDELGLMRVGDLLEDLPPGIGVDVDLKTSLEDAQRPRDETTAALVAQLVAPQAGWRPLLVSSFDPAALLIVRERAPQLPLGLLTWIRFPLRKAIPAAAHLGVQVIAPHVESFGLRLDAPRQGERAIADSVHVAHEAGLQVAAWCPLPAERDVLLAAGVDCLVVDDAV